MNNVNVAPLWQVLFPLTNQLMDLLEAPATRKFSALSETRPRVVNLEPKVKRMPLSPELRALADKYLEKKALLAGAKHVPIGTIHIEVPKHLLNTRKAESIVALFLADQTDRIEADQVVRALKWENVNTLRYHVRENSKVFALEDGYLVLKAGVTRSSV